MYQRNTIELMPIKIAVITGLWDGKPTGVKTCPPLENITTIVIVFCKYMQSELEKK